MELRPSDYARSPLSLGGPLESLPLQFEGMPVAARALVIDDVLADLAESQATALRANPTLLAIRCEAHLANLLPEELRPMLTDDDVGRLTALVTELSLPKVA